MRGRGIEFLSIFSGEDERAALDFLKHYRCDYPGAALYDFAGEEALAAGSWPTYIIVGPEGRIRLHVAGSARRYEARITETFEELTGPERMKRLDNGTLAYCDKDRCVIPPPKPLERRLHDRAPRTAVGPEVDLWIVFESNRDGDENIYLRRIRRGETVEEVRITADIGDDYSPDIAVDREGRIWVAWVSNRGGRYDIYIRSRDGAHWSEPTALTCSADDAMRPVLAVDGSGHLWAAWYEWTRLGDSVASRDRNVFARRLDDHGWSEPVEVSPVEPDVDDHADPAIAALHGSKAAVAVVWSLDYHPMLHDAPLQAKYPSIFLRLLGAGAGDGTVADVRLFGSTGKRVDLNPTVAALPDGGAIAAWDSLSSEAPGRSILAATWRPGARPSVVRLSSPEAHAISPTVAIAPDGTAHAAWAKKDGESWNLYGTSNTGGLWQNRTVLVAGPAEERSPQLICDKAGRLWLIYEERTRERTVIKVR